MDHSPRYRRQPYAFDRRAVLRGAALALPIFLAPLSLRSARADDEANITEPPAMTATIVNPTGPNVFAELLSAWNEPDPERRRTIVEASVTEGIVYDDVHRSEPLTGREALLDFLAFFRERVPGITNALDGDPEVVRGSARFRFAMERDGRPFSKGTYFADLAPDGRIARMTGFIDVEPRL